VEQGHLLRGITVGLLAWIHTDLVSGEPRYFAKAHHEQWSSRTPLDVKTMRDLLLDPVTGDLDLTGHKLSLTSADVAVAQRLRVRLRLLLREYILDEQVGTPYLALLGRKGALPRLDAMLRRTISTCPGVASTEAFRLVLEPDRVAVLNPLIVRMADGTPVDLSPFIAGAV